MLWEEIMKFEALAVTKLISVFIFDEISYEICRNLSLQTTMTDLF